MASSATDVAAETPQIVTEGLPTYKEAVKATKTVSAKKKWVIGGTVVIILVAMVITGALFGVYLQNKHTSDLVREVTINTKAGKEYVRADPEKGEEEYELPDKQFLVIHNFKKGFSVFRMKLNKTLACYLKPLNETNRLSPEALSSFLKNGGYEKAEEDPGEDSDSGPTGLVASDTHVRDPSFLSDRARSSCYGLFFYWLLPAEEKAEQGVRVKRGGCVGRFTYRRDCWVEYTRFMFWTVRRRYRCVTVYTHIYHCW